MAALTLPEALKRARNDVMAGMIKEIVTEDEMALAIPIESHLSTAVHYRREGVLPTTAFIGDDGAASEESTGQDNNVMVPMRRIVGNLDIDNFANDLTGAASGEQTAVQITKKTKVTWNLITQTLVTGAHVTGFAMSDNFQSGAYVTALVASSPYIDSARWGAGSIKYTNAGTLVQFRAPGDMHYGEAVAAASNGDYKLYSWNRSKWITVTLTVAHASADAVREISFTSSNDEFDGINKMVNPTSQLVTSTGANGDAFDFAMLDKLITRVKAGGNRAFFCNGSIIEKFYAAHRALGGTQPPTLALPTYGTSTRTVPAYRGFPILKNDNVPSTESKGGSSTLSSIYFASLDADEGLSLCAAGGQSLDVQADPRTRPVLGFRVERVGLKDESDHTRWRVKWYGAAKLKSELALARHSEVETN